MTQAANVAAPWGVLGMGVVALAALGVTAAALLRPAPGFAPVGDVGSLQSVLLANGALYFGTLESGPGATVVLGDVFYIQRPAQAQNGEPPRPPELVRRSEADWHAPKHMAIPVDRVVEMEPVGPASTVAKLITEARNRRAGQK